MTVLSSKKIQIGVIAAIVPEKEQDNYVEYISRFVGKENVYPMDIRAIGAVHIG